jgi:hypothetical protein
MNDEVGRNRRCGLLNGLREGAGNRKREGGSWKAEGEK